jgi:hypothetical protein
VKPKGSAVSKSSRKTVPMEDEEEEEEEETQPKKKTVGSISYHDKIFIIVI